MSMTNAFLSARADDLFESVAASADAAELEALDVAKGQMPARHAVVDVIENALRRKPNPGTRIALIKGDAGSGKTHVMTTVFRKLAGTTIGQFYPAVLQLTAPVSKDEYDVWLLDALFRELTARHFTDLHNQSPLQRLAERLLERIDTPERDEFLRLIDDIDDDGEIELSRRIARKITRKTRDLLTEQPPGDPFVAVMLLAGLGDWSAVNYLRRGKIDDRIITLGLEPIQTDDQRISLLKDFGLTAQMAGACIAIGFDQVENAVRLGDENLFIHTLSQATRVAEQVHNCAVIIAALSDEYDRITHDTENSLSLMRSDRDRIEKEAPVPARLERDTPEFLGQVIAKRLDILRRRAKVGNPDENPLAPLPEWLIRQVLEQSSVRLALREVAMFRRRALELGHMPNRDEYQSEAAPGAANEAGEIPDFDKLWADFLDLAPETRNRLLTSTKADLLAWWAQAASQEHTAGDIADVSSATISPTEETHIINVHLNSNGTIIERRELALCEAPNRDHKLAKQVEDFLDYATGAPAILRTKGFAKGRQAQVAPALRRLSAMNGLKLDLSETEWHNLQRARDFYIETVDSRGFLDWRRDRQWLTELMTPLQPLIAFPQSFIEKTTTATPENGVGTSNQRENNASHDKSVAPAADAAVSSEPFPVLLGHTTEGADINWDPYRPQPAHLNNFSFLVTGDAGSGKTQTIRVLIDAACRENLSVCIFDFKADYCEPEFTDPIGLEVFDIRTTGLPFNPLQPPPRGASGVQPAEHAYELAGVLARVFRLGPVQEGILRDAINSAYANSGIAPREWVDPVEPAWPSFDQVLDPLRDEPRAAALVTKLSMLSDLGLFPASSDKGHSFENFVDRRIALKLSDLPTDEIKSALAEIIIIQLHGYALRGDQPRRLKRLMVFDEAHRVKDSVRLEALAREGRAFGVGIVIGTQFPGDIPETMAGNLATQLYLMNNQASHRRWIVKQMFGTTSGSDARNLMEQLNALSPFEGLFSNTHYSNAMLRIIPHFQRQSGSV